MRTLIKIPPRRRMAALAALQATQQALTQCLPQQALTRCWVMIRRLWPAIPRPQAPVSVTQALAPPLGVWLAPIQVPQLALALVQVPGPATASTRAGKARRARVPLRQTAPPRERLLTMVPPATVEMGSLAAWTGRRTCSSWQRQSAVLP